MAQDFIAVDKNKNQGAKLLNAIATLHNVSTQLELLRDTMNHNIVSSDYTDVEALWGLAVGDGVTVYNALNTTVSQLAHADVLTLISRVGH